MTRSLVVRFAMPLLVLLTIHAAWPESSSAQSEAKPAVEITAFSAGQYEPGQWSLVGIHAVNNTAEDATGMLSVFVGNAPHQQYARRLWVPANAARQSWLPVRVPAEIDAKQGSVELTMLLVRETPSGEILERSAGAEMRRTILIPLGGVQTNTAIILPRRVPSLGARVGDDGPDAYELAAQARELATRSRRITDLSEELLPSHSLMWENFDQLILCSDRIRDDSAGLAAVRDWLHAGGRIWIFLDRVHEETVAALVGHAHCFREVDRVQLDKFVLEGSPVPFGPAPRDFRHCDAPVDFVRATVTNAAQVECQVDGWPAAFWQPVGEGEILYVTLGAPGWLPAPILPGEETLAESVDPASRQSGVLQALAERFFKPKPLARKTPVSLQPLLQNQIGHRIPRRSHVAGLFLLNFVVLSATGWWCLGSRQPDRMTLYLLASMAMTAVVFLALGRLTTRGVPATTAFTQFVRVNPDTGEASVAGTAAFFQHGTTPLTVESGPRGFFELMGAKAAGSVTRLIWGDDDRGHWQNLSIPAGSVQFATFRQPVRLPQPVDVTARFGPNGLEGRVSATSIEQLSDSLIAVASAPSLAVQVSPDGAFVARPDAILPRAQFVANQVLSDESRRHQEIYRQLLDPTDEFLYPQVPTLFGWSPSLACGMQWPPNSRLAGSALLAAPLHIARTEPGQRFVVPATFIRVELPSDEAGKSVTFNPRTGEWLPAATTASRSRLRFVLPEQVMPCQLTSATLRMNVSAPSRTLQVYAVFDGKELLVQEVDNPSGVYEMHLEGAQQLQLDAGGGLLLTISVSDSKQAQPAPVFREVTPGGANEGGAKSQSVWQIEYARLGVRGTSL